MSDFDAMKPYGDEQVSGVIARLTGDNELIDFLASYDAPVLSKLAPLLVRFLARRRVERLLGNVTTIRSFQEVVAQYVRRIVDETMTSFEFRGVDELDHERAHVFVSNHRDIAGDSMLVNYALYQTGLDTVRIAVGDNLVQRQFATDIMKLNKSFFINRSGDNPRKVYAALLDSSGYIHESIREGQSIWIAQAEGRAKDGVDRTDPAVIKMLALARRKDPFAEVVAELSIVPVTLSYEYDPCDVLKAEELTEIARKGKYEKPPGADLVSLARGLGGFKGRVLVNFGKPLSRAFESAEAVAAELDREILDRLQLYPVNLLALRELADKYGDPSYVDGWARIQEAIDESEESNFYAHLVDCPDEYKEQWLKIYANPVLNKLDLFPDR